MPGLCVFLIGIYPWVNLITYHGYPWQRAEVWFFPVVLAVAAVILGRWSEMARPGPRAVVFAMLLTLSFTVQLNLSPLAMVLTLAGSSAVGFLIRSHLVPVVVAALVVANATALVRSDGGALESGDVRPESALPPVIYIVFDGHQGVAAIPPHEPEGYVESVLNRTYLDAGFTLYTGAFSQYSATIDSLYNTLNFQAEPTYRFETAKHDPQASRVVPNRLFEALAESGYGFHVTRTEEVDLCAGIPESRLGTCRTQRVFNLASLADSDLTPVQRAGLMLKTLLFQSRTLMRFAGHMGVLTALDVTHFDIAEFQAFSRRIFSAGPGWVHVGHFLLPHAPYLYQADCSRRRSGPVWARLTHTSVPGFPANWPATRSERYARYLPQLLCANRLMGGLLAALEEAGILDRVHIIVQGDHGSRITETSSHPQNRSSLTRQDVLDTFSVLFAFRAAGPDAPMRVEEPMPVDRAMEQSAGIILGRAVDPGSGVKGGPFVYLSSGSNVVRLPLDGFTPRPEDSTTEPDQARGGEAEASSR